MQAASNVGAAGPSFQVRVGQWLEACFEAAATEPKERTHRFLEKALEFAQASGCMQTEAAQLVDYVFSRPVGELGKDAGAVMLTLAGLCSARRIEMEQAGESELSRVWQLVPQIRAKHRSRPVDSPLPRVVSPANSADESGFEGFGDVPTPGDIGQLVDRIPNLRDTTRTPAAVAGRALGEMVELCLAAGMDSGAIFAQVADGLANKALKASASCGVTIFPSELPKSSSRTEIACETADVRLALKDLTYVSQTQLLADSAERECMASLLAAERTGNLYLDTMGTMRRRKAHVRRG